MSVRIVAASASLSAALAALLSGGGLAARSGGSYWDPAWSPDGRRIVFAGRGDGPGDLYVMETDGSGLRKLTRSAYPGPNYGARQPVWSPDGRTIAFGYGYEGISLIDADGRNLRRLVRGLSFGAAWSPRGRKIAFAAGGELNGMSIYVIDPDGSNREPVARPPDSTYSYSGPAWSPDGQRLAFTVGPAPDTGNRDTYLGIIGRYRGKVSRYARGSYPVDPHWSPDGRRIVFSDWRGANGARQPRLAVLTLATRSVHRVGTGWHPRWSPDGRRIAFARAGRIWVMNADGSGARALTAPFSP
jgi:TolB protein